jgi:hypothetical protein
MASSPASCSRCGGSLERGFVLDEGYGKRSPAKWVEGAPEYWLWNLKFRGKRQLEISSYRCTRCGFLESFAQEASD